jgi:hypothetical protein
MGRMVATGVGQHNAGVPFEIRECEPYRLPVLTA